jgi:hypothetical protein
MRQLLKIIPLPVTLTVIAFLCPVEMSVWIGGSRFSPHRLVFLVFFPLAFYRLMRARDVKPHAFDIAFILYNIWTVGIFVHHGEGGQVAASNQGSGGGLQYGGALALESLAAYLIARAYIRDGDTFRAVVRLLFGGVALVGLIGLPETLLGQHFAHDFMNAMTGYGFPLKYEARLGLERAYSTFEHPIHYGTFCASVGAMVWFTERRAGKRNLRIAIIAGATLLGLSSAPLLCLGFQIAMIAWERGTRGVANRLTITMTIFAGLYVGASLVGSRTPIGIIATGMTLDSWTGYYRLVIWEHGIENFYANIWTGIGLGDWQRPWWMHSDSIDAFWLVIPLRAGLPAITTLVLGFALMLRGVWTKGKRNPDRAMRPLMLGWTMSLVALCLIGITVHFWNVLYAYLFFLVGMGGVFADPVRVRRKVTATADAVPAFETWQQRRLKQQRAAADARGSDLVPA